MQLFLKLKAQLFIKFPQHNYFLYMNSLLFVQNNLIRFRYFFLIVFCLLLLWRFLSLFIHKLNGYRHNIFTGNNYLICKEFFIHLQYCLLLQLLIQKCLNIYLNELYCLLQYNHFLINQINLGLSKLILRYLKVYIIYILFVFRLILINFKIIHILCYLIQLTFYNFYIIIFLQKLINIFQYKIQYLDQIFVFFFYQQKCYLQYIFFQIEILFEILLCQKNQFTFFYFLIQLKLQVINVLYFILLRYMYLTLYLQKQQQLNYLIIQIQKQFKKYILFDQYLIQVSVYQLNWKEQSYLGFHLKQKIIYQQLHIRKIQLLQFLFMFHSIIKLLFTYLFQFILHFIFIFILIYHFLEKYAHFQDKNSIIYAFIKKIFFIFFIQVKVIIIPQLQEKKESFFINLNILFYQLNTNIFFF
ncbi:hypothetical protein IMG5_202280 [Ichthyophthirius multifiliis]|uniref:Transmembrane protein n=1 Tax=Ichthyophthirius multifiliis TaxID=5932 RepID=G0R648_ICHMU|nr:hypothetical protein IMG5_202280 [Ichthyophthirius multifiliis]EGR27047.1 hypothetical protein IMG5_202280 [Ichthyophthirius multifiliis]|eukprot:XP_004023931.1 hypothetical protein IMG5_202280 [Ichthyophthirius multifiliis]